MSYKKIIDVSKHNGAIDFKKVKADGIAAVIIRAGYGKNKLLISVLHLNSMIKVIKILLWVHLIGWLQKS